MIEFIALLYMFTILHGGRRSLIAEIMQGKVEGLTLAETLILLCMIVIICFIPKLYICKKYKFLDNKKSYLKFLVFNQYSRTKDIQQTIINSWQMSTLYVYVAAFFYLIYFFNYIYA